MRKKIYKIVVFTLLVINMMILPTSAANYNDFGIAPCYNHTQSAILSIGFDDNFTVYCSLSVLPYPTGTGTSGIMRLHDSTGAIIAEWPVSDYVEPIDVEFTYPGTYGETYILTYQGYVYGNNMTAPDWIDISITDSCVYN